MQRLRQFRFSGWFGLVALLVLAFTFFLSSNAGETQPTAMVVGLILALVTFGIGLFFSYRLSHSLDGLTKKIESMVAAQKFAVDDELSALAAKNGSFGGALVSLLEAVKEKAYWYESLLDAIPFPISVTDMDMNWTFINKPVEGIIGRTRGDGCMGLQCDTWNAHICNTENCGIARLRAQKPETFFDQVGRNFKVDTSYILDTKGEPVGHIEVVQDITALVSSSQYQDKAIDQVAGYLAEISQGVLNFNVAQLENGNEYTEEARRNFERINASLVQARDMLNQTIKVVVDNAVKVNTASEQLASAANQSSDAANQIATVIQQVAHGTNQTTEAVSKTVTTIQEVTRTIDGVAEGTQKQAEAVNQALEITRKITSKDGISAKVGLSAQKVQDMGVRSEQIGAIVETIEDISAQTNLLALNAAIEAARAGEHGKGFAVVADEVRKLAERAGTATQEIDNLIKGIKESVADAVTMVTSAAGEIDVVSNELSEAINSVSDVVQENTIASQNLLDQSGIMMSSIENIASTSQENSAAGEEIGASVQEMTAQIEEMTASAASLAELSHSLQAQVGQFQLADEGDYLIAQ